MNIQYIHDLLNENNVKMIINIISIDLEYLLSYQNLYFIRKRFFLYIHKTILGMSKDSILIMLSRKNQNNKLFILTL